MHDIINLHYLAASLIYSLMGVAIFWGCFVIIDRLTPYHLWKNLIEDKNQALAIVVGSMCIGIAIIIAASIAG